jgi:SAM-dependent methyltransferase
VSHDQIRRFYDEVYYRGAHTQRHISWHIRRLAARLEPWEGRRLLDVGCGTGQWLMAAAEHGAIPVGIDISQVAIDACRKALPAAELHCGPAETLPYGDSRFDFVSCLGSLEHFLDMERALQEMARVAQPGATLLFLVPNAGFLPRRLGIFRGTWQAEIREDVRTLTGWRQLFESAGLRVISCWRDLHLLSWSWIRRGRWYLWPLRAAQAMALPFWPLSWQYQLYYFCEVRKQPRP